MFASTTRTILEAEIGFSQEAYAHVLISNQGMVWSMLDHYRTTQELNQASGKRSDLDLRRLCEGDYLRGENCRFPALQKEIYERSQVLVNAQLQALMSGHRLEEIMEARASISVVDQESLDRALKVIENPKSTHLANKSEPLAADYSLDIDVASEIPCV